MFRVAALIVLITVHQIDGRAVQINPKQVTQMVEPRDDHDPKKQFHDGVNCIISFADGKYLSVAETCEAVKKLIEQEE